MPNTPPDLSIQAPPAKTTIDYPDITVTVGEVDVFALNLNPQTPVAYLNWGATTYYQTDNGRRWSATAGLAGSRVAFWRCHGGITLKSIVWVAQGAGGPLTFPHPDTGNIVDVCISTMLSAGFPTVMPSGQELITVVGVYRYVMQMRAAETDILAVGKSPLSQKSAYENTLNISLFSKNLMASISPPAGFQGQAITF
jgi:hypothetical protein